MEYASEELNRLHNTLKEILDYVDDICKKNKLIYFLAGGTALGAKRHQGFIPWDDDLDIVMPREDYDKLINIINNDRECIYKIQDEDSEENYFLPFVKVRKQGTVFREDIVDGLYEDNGIYIDVFPIDTIDEKDSLSIKLDFLQIKLIIHVLRFRSCRKFYKWKNGRIRYTIDSIVSFFFCKFSNKVLLNRVKQIMKKRNNKPKKYVASFAGLYGLEKEIMSYDTYFPPKLIKFQNKEYPCFSNLEKYLEQMYGNYMELPSEDKRHTHKPIEIKF